MQRLSRTPSSRGARRSAGPLPPWLVPGQGHICPLFASFEVNSEHFLTAPERTCLVIVTLVMESFRALTTSEDVFTEAPEPSWDMQAD